MTLALEPADGYTKLGGIHGGHLQDAAHALELSERSVAPLARFPTDHPPELVRRLVGLTLAAHWSDSLGGRGLDLVVFLSLGLSTTEAEA